MSNVSSHHNDAFISYNGADAAFAQALESALESYRPPKQLTDRTGHPRVFRYEGDMVGSDYDEAINKHLEQSRFLILVCSPEASASQYVNDEIERFAGLKSPHYIIPVLLRGQPNNAAGRDGDKAFPPALTDLVRMPLGIDFRGFDTSKDNFGKGRFESPWYQLLANLYEVSRDDMEQRERARRLRRRTQWAVASTMVTFIVAILAVVAWVQRGMALEAQAGAEAQLLTLQAERSERTDQPEVALMIAAQAIRKSLDHQALFPRPGAVSIIYRQATRLEGAGLAGFQHPWPVQRNTEPWAAGDASGRWLVTGNFGGNGAIAWDLASDYVPGSGRLLTDAPDNYSSGDWIDNIGGYIRKQFPDVEGDWILPAWDSPSDGPLPEILKPLVDVKRADGSSFGTDRLFVTADNRWLILLGDRTHRLIDLESKLMESGYSARVTAFDWIDANKALYTAHRNGEIHRWSATGQQRALLLYSEDGLGIRNFIVDANEEHLLLQTDVGDWNFWSRGDDKWRELFERTSPEHLAFTATLYELDYHRSGRLGNPYDPYWPDKAMSTPMLEFGSAGEIVANLADRSVRWIPGVESAWQTSPNTASATQAESLFRIGEHGSISVISPDRQWRVSFEGLQRRVMSGKSFEALDDDQVWTQKHWSEPQAWPEFGRRLYPAIYTFSADERWLVFGVGYSGRSDCGMQIDLYRLDLMHPAPLTTLTPLKGGISARDGEEKCPVVEFSRGGNWLLADGALWRLQPDSAQSDPILLPGPGLSISPDETLVAVEVKGPSGWHIRMLPLEPESVADLACLKAGRNLILSEWRELFAGQPYEALCPENFQ
ncbi:MAG TPA: toll/interleukin-1 receptor domain-containing protein [Xanthomonadales bacterium]|nr:toll/interleukin-1 receptor domain-containing protein [Xanthomonadales bacterium]